MGKKLSVWSLLALLTIFILIAFRPDGAERESTVTVSAAASLKEALTEIEASFREEHPEVDIQFNYGASGALMQQIKQGAPVDLFLSASPSFTNTLLEEGILKESNVKPLLENHLVLIVPPESAIQSMADLQKEEIRSVSIGIPESVPAGQYAKEILENAGLWESLQQKIVFAKDVKQVLSYVETGNVEAGMVYRTDALSSDKVHAAEVYEGEGFKPANYPLALLESAENKEDARKLFDFLLTEDAKAIFYDYGFTVN